MSATPTLSQCRRNNCANMVITSGGKKYCSDRCGRAAALNRRRARAETTLEDAVKGSGSYTMKKLMQSARYLADCYNVDPEYVKDLLIEDMERRFTNFWDEPA